MGEGAKSGSIYGNPPLNAENSGWLENNQVVTAGEMAFNTLILKNNEKLLYKQPVADFNNKIKFPELNLKTLEKGALKG